MSSKKVLPPQHQDLQPGIESQMSPAPKFHRAKEEKLYKLQDKVAIITGGDSGIGRAVAVAFAQEGADVVIVYLNEHDDAKKTQAEVEKRGRKCLLLAGDVGDEAFCQEVAKKTVEEFKRIDVLVNNAAEQHPQDNVENISAAQLEKTFRTNIFAYFFLTKAVLPLLPTGEKAGVIINTTSVTAYRGSEHLIDYSSTKGAIVSFTRSLALNLASKGIRVNAVAPGPVWTPLIPATFSAEHVATFGADVPLGRPGQPEEIAPAFVFLASADSSYMTGQVLHPNGGEVINT